MSSPPSKSEPGGDSPSSSFELLDERVRRWIWQSKWSELHDIQEDSIPAISGGSTDVIVAAPTAAGKTEAAFLPICSSLAAEPPDSGLGALYISPLKALINDQRRRLEPLCEAAGIELNAWHGDVSAALKQKVREQPSGILLITPESLEAIFVNHGTAASRLYEGLRFVVIDELHAFIGSERGRQLQSLLHRIELAGRHRVPRIGLSATLGDMGVAAGFLRPGEGGSVRMIESTRDPRVLKVQLRGYLSTAPRAEAIAAEGETELEDLVDGDRLEIADHLYRKLRGEDNLVFANARRSVEEFADLLRRRCERERVPVEFWPHHGNLSKALREDVEQMLRDPSTPRTAICTSTLELGIDVGSISCVGQIDPPFSAAALRQRLGRCGRRPQDPSVLRMYVSEEELAPDAWRGDELREGLVQSIAVVDALVEGWFEPPVDGAFHLSTLVQQVLSAIAQHGGARAEELWTALCRSGPFELDRESFATLLRGLADRDVIQQAGDADLILSPLGERIVGHYSFYTAFITPEEYRLLAEGEEIGSLPLSSPLTEGSYLIFAGRRWRVLEVDTERKLIAVEAAKGGRVPHFTGKGGGIHDGIRERMRAVYEATAEPAFLDAEARALLAQGRRAFAELGLAEHQIVPSGSGSVLFPWAGDRVVSTLALGLQGAGHEAVAEGLLLTAPRTPADELQAALESVFGPDAEPDGRNLAASVRNLETEKHHWLVDPELLMRDCATARLDVAGAMRVVGALPRRARAKGRTGGAASPELVVVDCETTGLHPGHHHRIVELALITVDAEGRPTDRWCSLLRPDRDLGPAEVHGITGRELLDAPAFGDVLGDVLERIAGRAIVAHNARFDRAFLANELARSGVDAPPLPILCTMELASRLGIGGTRRRLRDCREALGGGLEGEHTALGDALACSAILARYIEDFGAASVRAHVDGRVQAAELWPGSDKRGPCCDRSPAFSGSAEPSWLSQLADAAASGESAADAAPYLNLLDSAIEDRRLDRAEREELIAAAATLGIDGERLEEIHREYVEALIATAWRDGALTKREREDLFLVAEALGVTQSASEALQNGPQPTEPQAKQANGDLRGKTVCFTGALSCRFEGESMTRELATRLALRAGLVVMPGVTKSLDLLVMADPNSTSGKAKKAREYGTRILAETAFWPMIGIETT